MTALLLKFAPWLAGAIALLSLGAWSGYHLNPWHGRYTSLQAADAIERGQAQAAVRKTLSAQLAQAQEVTHNNQAAMVTLANQNAQTTADRDATVAHVHRLEQLLSAPTTRTPASGQLSQAGDRPPAAGSGGDPSTDEIGDLLVGARDEAKRNANRLDALIAEINPQL